MGILTPNFDKHLSLSTGLSPQQARDRLEAAAEWLPAMPEVRPRRVSYRLTFFLMLDLPPSQKPLYAAREDGVMRVTRRPGPWRTSYQPIADVSCNGHPEGTRVELALKVPKKSVMMTRATGVLALGFSALVAIVFPLPEVSIGVALVGVLVALVNRLSAGAMHRREVAALKEVLEEALRLDPRLESK